MAKYQAYPEYKDSGIEWLGNVPLNWTVCRLGDFALKIGSGKTPRGGSEIYRDDGVLFLRSQNVYDDGLRIESSDSVYIAEQVDEEMANTRVQSGDILLNITGGSIGRTCIVPESFPPANVNQHVCIVRMPERLRNFISYFMKSSPLKEQIDFLQNGGNREGLNFEQIRKFCTVIPTEDELKTIANFLDHETAKIDTLIEKQQQLIQLLKEKRQAVISHAVTKGLNPDALMKDSGVEWLGQVPAYWKVTKFNYEIDLLEGPGILAVDFHEEGVPLLRIQNVKEEFVTNDFKTYLSPAKVKTKWEHFRVSLGDLIISCSASTGLVSEVAQDTVGSIPYTGLIRLRPKSKLISKDFIRILVQSDLFFEQINLLQAGSTIQHFGPYHLQQMYITLPPIREQFEIFQFVKNNLDLLDAVVQATNHQIELMMERRTALISAAVTGKIDVRNWQAPTN